MQPLSASFNPLQRNASYSPREGEESSRSTPPSAEEIRQDPKQAAVLAELGAVDTKVRAHEAAHMAAGGGVVSGGATYSYTRGPDGKMYATGGEVPISLSEGNTPQENIQKAQQVVAAALAPADPSPQDYKVAATAAMMEMRAHMEMTRQLQNSVQGEKTYASAAEKGEVRSSAPSRTPAPEGSPAPQ